MKLYDWQIAPNPRRVRMYLAEKGIEVEMEQAAPPNTLDLNPDFLAKSDRRRVPLLELDDGTLIGEAMAICRYFETDHPEPRLFGTGARERGLAEMWERESEICGLHSGGECVRNSHPAFAGRALPGYAEPTPQIPELVERGRMRYHDWLKRVDDRLADNRYLAGENFTVADITAFCTIDFWGKFRLPVPDGLGQLQRWYGEVGQRPSTQA
ncbi:MAG: glutathione S-transferase family protein [Salinisphaera sp.]|nr:glutathione S-transferase family protein [Salinisphaera sp.]